MLESSYVLLALAELLLRLLQLVLLAFDGDLQIEQVLVIVVFRVEDYNNSVEQARLVQD